MTDNEPTPPARPDGAPSPWASEPPRRSQPPEEPRDGYAPQDAHAAQDAYAPAYRAEPASPWSSGAPDTQPLSRPVPPVASQPWAQGPGAAPQPWAGGPRPSWDDRPTWADRPTWEEQPTWADRSSAAPVDTLGRARRGRRGGGGFVALVVALSLLAGLLGGVLGSVLTQRTDLVPPFAADPASDGGADGSADGSAEGSATSEQDGAASALPPGMTGSVAEIAAQVLPSVVSISVRTGQGNGTGSGFVIDDEGLILTNNHVIAAGGSEPADDIVVELSDGSQAEAEVVGADASYDIAVLRIDPADTGGLTELPFGDSDRVVVGEQVVAVGAPLGLDATVTTGIVSALNRPVSAGDAQQTAFINAIQTDAAINPGNSGGPLVNMRGEVVGVNSAIAQAPGGRAGGSIGLGFSIPSNQADRTAGQLITDGVATFPVVGVLLDRAYDGEGVRIVTDEDATDAPPVTPGGPADAAGLQAGDVILAFEGRPMTESDELVVAIRAREPGDEVTLTVRRDDEVFDVDLVLQAGDQG